MSYHCSICGESNKRLYCGPCTSHLTLRARINVIKLALQLKALQTSVEEALNYTDTKNNDSNGNEARTELLGAQISALQQKIERIQQATLVYQNESLQLRKRAQTIHAQATSGISAANQRQKMSSNARTSRINQVAGSMSALEEKYVQTFKASLNLQSRCCQDLLEVFALKKKRRKPSDNGYEIVLGFNVIPELPQLGHYSVSIINSGLERVAYFGVLLANYLGIRLPFQMDLPQRDYPRLRIEGEELYLAHSVKTMMRASPRDFHNYCRLLAMLSLDIAHLAAKLGIPPSIGAPVVARLSQLVAQIYLRIEGLIKSGHQIQIHTASVNTDVDTLQDQLITLIDVEMNGNSAEWNIIDAPANPAIVPGQAAADNLVSTDSSDRS